MSGIVAAYGLRLRAGIDLFEVLFALHCLVSREAQVLLNIPDFRRAYVPELGRSSRHSSRAAMVYFSAALENLDGTPVTLAELYRRHPG